MSELTYVIIADLQSQFSALHIDFVRYRLAYDLLVLAKSSL